MNCTASSHLQCHFDRLNPIDIAVLFQNVGRSAGNGRCPKKMDGLCRSVINEDLSTLELCS